MVNKSRSERATVERTEARAPGPDDDALMARVAQGDETALRLLVDRWELPLLGFLTRMLGNPEDARDLAQECFLHVYRHAGRYDARGRFRSWIFRIAGNLSRSRLRRRRIVRWLSLDRDDGIEEPVAPRTSEADAPHEASELRRAIRASLSRLPERQRMAFSLRRFEGLSYREIAEALESSESAVESLLVRATSRMQDELRARGYGEES